MNGKLLRMVRKSKKLTLDQLSEIVNISVSQLSRFESEQRKPRLDEVERIAKALGVATFELAPELLRDPRPGDFITDRPMTLKGVKVVGIVQAGLWTEFEDFEDAAYADEIVPSVPGSWASLPQTAYKVKGASMDMARIYDGDFVVVVPYFDARPDIKDGDTVLVERRRAGAVERTVKIIEIEGKTIRLMPKSSNPQFKPIKITIDKTIHEDDGIEVRLIGLVVGRWTAFQN